MRSDDILKNFIEGIYNLSKMHYHSYKLDKEICLNYTAKILDNAYGGDHYGFLDKYYDEYLNRKDEFKKINIYKENNDYIIKIDESLLNEEYIKEHIEKEEIPF